MGTVDLIRRKRCNDLCVSACVLTGLEQPALFSFQDNYPPVCGSLCVCVCVCKKSNWIHRMIKDLLCTSRIKSCSCECACICLTERNVCGVLQRVASFGRGHHAEAHRCHRLLPEATREKNTIKHSIHLAKSP